VRRWEVRRESRCGAMDGSEGRRRFARLESDESDVSMDCESPGIGAIATMTVPGLSQSVDELDSTKIRPQSNFVCCAQPRW